MSDISKFIADIQRIKKHQRADNSGIYNGEKVCRQIADLFTSNNRAYTDFSRSIADYWLNTYVLSSPDLQDEPSEENINRLTAFQSFIDGDEDGDYSALSKDDWETLKDFADDEAESMDLLSLQNMMSLILKNGAI